jgi:hypothetical protein
MRKAHRLTDLLIQLDDEDHRAETLPAGNRVMKLGYYMRFENHEDRLMGQTFLAHRSSDD